jgi:uncharacterized membrane protein
MDNGVLVFNSGALVLGIILGILSFNYYKKMNKKKVGIYWAIGCVVTCLFFVNGIIKIVAIMDEHTKENAFELLDERFAKRGDHENESYDNLELVVSPEKGKFSTDYNIYVANFNKQYTYKGKVKVTFKDKKDEVILIHTTEMVTIKPGEKKEIESASYKTWNPGYSWQWLGELKK